MAAFLFRFHGVKCGGFPFQEQEAIQEATEWEEEEKHRLVSEQNGGWLKSCSHVDLIGIGLFIEPRDPFH